MSNKNIRLFCLSLRNKDLVFQNFDLTKQLFDSVNYFFERKLPNQKKTSTFARKKIQK